MITNSNYRTVDVWRWPVILIGLLLLLAAGGEPVRQWLRFDRAAIEGGQWWRLVTAHFVHLGWYHTLLNVIGLWVLALLCPQPLPARVWLQRLLVLTLGISLCLYAFAPGERTYVGLSGVAHGLFLLGLVAQLRQRELVIIGCLIYLLGKLAYEQIVGAPVSDEAAIGGHVVTSAHLYGVLMALAYGLLAGSFTGREVRSAEPARSSNSSRNSS